MRSTALLLVAAAFTLACADAPTSPLLQPESASFSLGKAPPPWALVEGEVTTDGEGALLSISALRNVVAGPEGGPLLSHSGGNAATYRAWLLVTPGDRTALLRFTNDGTAQFSNGAMITSVNGKVSGRGTMTVSGHTYELSAVTDFDANGECADIPWNYSGPSCASFSADDGSFSSAGSVWTGILSNDGGGGEFDLPPGWDQCKRGGCVCINCEDIIGTFDTKGKAR